MAVYERYELTVLDEKQKQVEKLHQAYKLWIETKKVVIRFLLLPSVFDMPLL